MTSIEAAPSYRTIYDSLRQRARGVSDSSKRIPSYRQLAKQFEVSESTVIRAVNLLKRDGWAYGRQGKGTFLRNRPTANEALQFALLTPTLDGEASHYVRGLSRVTDSHEGQYTLATYSTHGDREKYLILLEQVIQQKPAGLILLDAPQSMRDSVCRALKGVALPTVVIGEPVDGLDCDVVHHTNQDSARLLRRHLRRKPLGNVGLLLSEPEIASGELQVALHQELVRAGLNLNESNILRLPTPRGHMAHADPYIDIQRQMADRFAQGFRCQTLICCHDYAAIGALRAAQQAGIRIPEDMKILSALRCAVDGAETLKLTTVDSHRDDQAELAARLLVRRIGGHDGPAQIHYVSGELIEGQTS